MVEIKGGRPANIKLIIDRDSDQPVYLQLAEILRQLILDGAFHPGEKMPSEVMLVEMYKVSPMTVRRAINLLAAQGIVTTAQGKGTYVKEVELESAAFYLRDIKDLFNPDENTKVKLIEARFLSADERIARKLKIRTGEKVIYIRRVLTIEDEPVYYHRGYLVYDPTRPVVESEFRVTDLKGLFQGADNSLIKSGEISMEATSLNAEEAQILKLALPASGMMLEHLFFDFQDRPISWGWFVCSSSRLRLHTHIGLENVNGIRDERTR